VTASGVAEVIGTAFGAATVPAITVSGTAERIITSSGVSSIPAVTASGTSAQTIFAYPNISKLKTPAIKAEGIAQIAKFASGAVTLGPIQADGFGPGVTTKRAIGRVTLPSVIARGHGPNIVWERMSLVPQDNTTSFVPYVESTSTVPYRDIDTEEWQPDGSFEYPEVIGRTNTFNTQVRRRSTLSASGAAILNGIRASGGVIFPNPASGSVILTPFTSSGIARIPPIASGSPSIPIITGGGAVTVTGAPSGDSRFVTVAEVNAGLGMYGLYGGTGSIDNHLVPATNGNTYIERAYSRTDSGVTWRLRWNNSGTGADPGSSVSQATWTFIDVVHSAGTMRLTFSRVSNGGDIFLDSFGSSGFAYMNAPAEWDAGDVGQVREVIFIP
jgi:hypothetical protein